MASKAQRRKRKISLPGGETIPQRAATDPRREKKEDPMMTVATARMRRTGIENAMDAVQPICGTDIGLCIRELTTGDDRAAAINTWEALSASHRNYRELYIGMTGNPQGAAIAMVPEPMETDPSLRVDLRTHDERIEAAKRSWATWEAKINALPVPNMKWALRGALEGFMGEGALWRDMAPTPTGRLAVEALRRVNEGA